MHAEQSMHTPTWPSWKLLSLMHCKQQQQWQFAVPEEPLGMSLSSSLLFTGYLVYSCFSRSLGAGVGWSFPHVYGENSGWIPLVVG